MAEAMACELGGDAVEAESAGIGAIPGNRATPEAVQAARERGFDLEGHRGRFTGDLDLDSYDLVVALTPSIAARLRHRFDSNDGRLVVLDIDDPYGGDLDDYRRSAAEIEEAVRQLMGEIVGAVDRR